MQNMILVQLTMELLIKVRNGLYRFPLPCIFPGWKIGTNTGRPPLNIWPIRLQIWWGEDGESTKTEAYNWEAIFLSLSIILCVLFCLLSISSLHSFVAAKLVFMFFIWRGGRNGFNRGKSILRAIRRGGPWKLILFWALKWQRMKRVLFGHKNKQQVH